MTTKSIPLPKPPAPPSNLEVIGYLHSDTQDGKFRKANKNSLVRNSKGELLYVGKKRYIKPICDLGLPPVPPMPKEDEDGIVNAYKPNKRKKDFEDKEVKEWSNVEIFLIALSTFLIMIFISYYAK